MRIIFASPDRLDLAISMKKILFSFWDLKEGREIRIRWDVYKQLKEVFDANKKAKTN